MKMKLVDELLRSLPRQQTTNILRNWASKRPAQSVQPCRPITRSRPRRARQAADDPNFTSILDNPPDLVRSGRKHGPGLIILGTCPSPQLQPFLTRGIEAYPWHFVPFVAIIPITAFVLGTWQVQRLKWKTDLIAKCEDRLARPPLPLPPRIDPAAVADFDYRRVRATGRFRHDKEMLIGPRMRDGEQGYMVVTPLERGGEGGDGTVLVNRGWIAKSKADQRTRPDSLPGGEVTVEGLLREPWKKNMFTPENKPDKGEFYFPDVEQMASLSGSQAVWVEQTMSTIFFLSLRHRKKDEGIFGESDLKIFD